jgi:uncharacterized protein YjbI with pentapeptide repeats
MSDHEPARESYWPTCSSPGCVGIRLEGNKRCLAHAGPQAREAFLDALKPGADLDLRGVPVDPGLLGQLLAALRPADGVPELGTVQFEGARFCGDVGFEGAQFRGEAGFQGAQFTGVVSFNRAKFGGIASFDRARFSGTAEFRGVHFSEIAWFEETQFRGEAGFEGAHFGKLAWFLEAQFDEEAAFRATEFRESAWFADAEFRGDAWFDRAQVSGEAGFNHAEFSGDAGFEGAQFKQPGTLGPLLAASHLILDRATFEQDIVIEAVTTRLCCVATRFNEGASLRLRYAHVVLDGAVFAKPSTITFAPDAFTHDDPAVGGEVESFDEGTVAWFESNRSPRPRLLSLRGVDVAALTLSELDLAACLFQGAHQLDQLRIEGARPFADTPSAWRVRIGRWWMPVWRRWSRRQTLAEEHHWRSEHPSPPRPGRRARLIRPAWHGPACQTPEWVTERTEARVHQVQRVQRLTPGRLAVLYRSLRKAQEDSKNEPGAADFYYGEMELRRSDRQTPWAERVILWLYWLVAGYGLRGLRALASLAVVIVALAAILHVVGYSARPSPPSYWGSLLYAASSTLSIADDQVRLTGWGKLFRITLRLAGPVLLGLTLLSVRNRVKR